MGDWTHYQEMHTSIAGYRAPFANYTLRGGYGQIGITGDGWISSSGITQTVSREVLDATQPLDLTVRFLARSNFSNHPVTNLHVSVWDGDAPGSAALFTTRLTGAKESTNTGWRLVTQKLSEHVPDRVRNLKIALWINDRWIANWAQQAWIAGVTLAGVDLSVGKKPDRTLEEIYAERVGSSIERGPLFGELQRSSGEVLEAGDILEPEEAVFYQAGPLVGIYDSFALRQTSGVSLRSQEVEIQTTEPELMARDMTVGTRMNQPLWIPLDQAPEGYASVLLSSETSQGGTVTLEGNKVLYTPAQDYHGAQRTLGLHSFIDETLNGVGSSWERKIDLSGWTGHGPLMLSVTGSAGFGATLYF